MSNKEIVVQVVPDFKPEDGTQFDAVLAALNHFEIPAQVLERDVSFPGAARQFMRELLESVETLTGVAEAHGSRTLADLMYLQNAVLNGSYIEHYPGDSAVMEVVSALPSGELWATHINVVVEAGQEPSLETQKHEILNGLGYDILIDVDQPGKWIWWVSSDGCDASFNTKEEAVSDAWADAADQTMAILNFTSEEWDALSFPQQKTRLIETLSSD